LFSSMSLPCNMLGLVAIGSQGTFLMNLQGMQK